MRESYADDQWSTSDLPDVRASLRIRGGDIDLDLITQLLGGAPSPAAATGLRTS